MADLTYTATQLDVLSAATANSIDYSEDTPTTTSRADESTIEDFKSLCSDHTDAPPHTGPENDLNTAITHAGLMLVTDEHQLDALVSAQSGFSSVFSDAPLDNGLSFQSAGAIRGRRGDCGDKVSQMKTFKSFYQQPDLNDLNEYEDGNQFESAGGHQISFRKASQYHLADLRDYTVMHTHPYWLKVQDPEHEPMQATSVNSFYISN